MPSPKSPKKFLTDVVDCLALGLLKGLVNLINFLPAAVGIGLSRLIVKLLMTLKPSLQKVARRNLSLAFSDKAPEELELIKQKSEQVLAQNFYNFCRIPYFSREDYSLIECDSHDVCLDAMADAGKTGVLYVASHFGPFERFFQLHCLHHRPAKALARGFGLPRLDDWSVRWRSVHGAEIIWRKGAYKGIVDALKEGTDVVVMFDQNVKKNHAVFTQLFGLQAATTKTCALSAIRIGCPLVFTYCYYKASGAIYAHYKRIDTHAECRDVEERVLKITQSLQTELEVSIRESPESWFWIHRRFKTRPAGEKETIYS